MWIYVERVLTVTVATAAIIVAGVAVHRELAPAVTIANKAPEYVSDWTTLRKQGLELGNGSGTVSIVEFSDMQCPFCRQFHESTLKTLRARFPEALSIQLIHTPLAMHRYARAASRAIECGAEHGKAPELVDDLFAKQDSLGTKSWGSFGADVHIDTIEFAKCVTSTKAIPRLESHAALVRALGIHATPTILVNGWRLAAMPQETTFVRMIGQLAAGEPARRVVGGNGK